MTRRRVTGVLYVFASLWLVVCALAYTAYGDQHHCGMYFAIDPTPHSFTSGLPIEVGTLTRNDTLHNVGVSWGDDREYNFALVDNLGTKHELRTAYGSISNGLGVLRPLEVEPSGHSLESADASIKPGIYLLTATRDLWLYLDTASFMGDSGHSDAPIHCPLRARPVEVEVLPKPAAK